jgi:hypothetical protein
LRTFELHPVRFADGQTVEEDSIGALLLYDDGYEFEWDEPERNRLLEERLAELLEDDQYEVSPHPNPAIKGRIKRALEPGSDGWLNKVADLLEGPRFRIRLVEFDSEFEEDGLENT